MRMSPTAAVFDAILRKLANVTEKNLEVAVLLVLPRYRVLSSSTETVPRYLREARLPPERLLSLPLFALNLARQKQFAVHSLWLPTPLPLPLPACLPPIDGDLERSST